MIPGPSSTPTPSARHSAAIAPATSSTSARSHEAASEDSVGKHVAGSVFVRLMSSEDVSLRRPVGPSDTQTDGIPSRSTGTVVQASRPTVSAAFSSSVSCASSSSARVVVATRGVSQRALKVRGS